jgi:hypothetical protein
MDGKIVELRRVVHEGRLIFEALYLIPMAQIIVNDVPVVLRPRSELPPIVVNHGLISVAELTAIDEGLLTFVEDRVPQRAGESLQSVLDRVRNRFAIFAAKIQAEAEIAYTHTGDCYPVVC